MTPGIKSYSWVAFAYLGLSLVAGLAISLINRAAPLETTFFLTLLGPIAFLLPYLKYGFQERFLVFALSYIVTSLIVVPLLTMRLYRSTTMASILFYLGVAAWFAAGYVAFLANTSA